MPATGLMVKLEDYVSFARRPNDLQGVNTVD